MSWLKNLIVAAFTAIICPKCPACHGAGLANVIDDGMAVVSFRPPCCLGNGRISCLDRGAKRRLSEAQTVEVDG